MKKRSQNKIIIIFLFAVIGLCVEKTASANHSSIYSKGNFILGDGEKAAFYANDIAYLQREIEALFNEIDADTDGIN